MRDIALFERHAAVVTGEFDRLGDVGPGARQVARAARQCRREQPAERIVGDKLGRLIEVGTRFGGAPQSGLRAAAIEMRFARRLAWVPWLAVLIAEVCVTAGYAIAWTADLPPGQVAVAMLGGAMVLAWAWPPSWRH